MLFSSKYERWYWVLINRALFRKTPPPVGENHHIFPQCVYGKNSFTVKLTHREHYIAHLLLAKIQGKNHPKLWLAILRMNKPGIYNSRVYELARKKASEWRSIKNKEELDYSSILPKLHRNNSILQNRPWKNFNVKQENLYFWKKADIVWDMYVNKKYPHKKMHSYICNQIGLPTQKLKILRNIIKLIDSGWNPQKDDEWLLFCQN
jgi:hypothetical protein